MSEDPVSLADAAGESPVEIDGPPPDPVRQHPQHGAAEQLHDPPDGGEQGVPDRGIRRATPHHFPDQVGQNRDHQTERDGIHQRSGENEPEGGTAATLCGLVGHGQVSSPGWC